MVDGAVFGLFTYRADWENQPWVEFDYEFVGADTTKVQINIHMEDANGNHIALSDAMGGPVIIDLGFDASAGMHTYEVTVGEAEAVFLIDGREVGRFSAADMPGGVWQIGPMRSFVDLWAVAPAQESWAGEWTYPGAPLVATLGSVSIHEGDLGNLIPDAAITVFVGDSSDNLIIGTAHSDSIDGLGGNDTLRGGFGDDSLYGGEGSDQFDLDAGDDFLDGGSGLDDILVTGTAAAIIDLSLVTAQNTGYGRLTLVSIENVSGGSGADTLQGNDGANVLRGNGGSDILRASGGNDMLSGGDGNDRLYGGDGDDTVYLDPGNDLIDGGTGIDWIVVTSTSAATIDLSNKSVQGTGAGTDTIVNIENLGGGGGADRLTGSSSANILIGNAGADTLKGEAGADTLVGGTGKDVLYGGADNDCDIFVFKSADESGLRARADAICDFTSGVDLIDLTLIDAQATNSDTGDAAFLFSRTTAAAFSVWYAKSGQDLIVHADVTGDAKADFQIRLVDTSTLAIYDFLL